MPKSLILLSYDWQGCVQNSLFLTAIADFTHRRSRRQVAQAMADYADRMTKQQVPLHRITRHMLGL